MPGMVRQGGQSKAKKRGRVGKRDRVRNGRAEEEGRGEDSQVRGLIGGGGGGGDCDGGGGEGMDLCPRYEAKEGRGTTRFVGRRQRGFSGTSRRQQGGKTPPIHFCHPCVCSHLHSFLEEHKQLSADWSDNTSRSMGGLREDNDGSQKRE